MPSLAFLLTNLRCNVIITFGCIIIIIFQLSSLFSNRIGVAEKGYLTVELKVEGETGHASQVPYESSITILAKALSKYISSSFTPFNCDSDS